MSTLVLKVVEADDEDINTLQRIDFLTASKAYGIDQVMIVRDDSSYTVKVDPYLIVDKRKVLIFASFEFDWLGNRNGLLSVLKLKFIKSFGRDRFLILT